MWTPPAFHDPVIDGVRAIAVSWVILLHLVLYHIEAYQRQTFHIFDAQLLHWLARGDLGVDLFFVISGYLIGTLLIREYANSGTIRLKRFYVRRFLRLIPVYMVAMVLALYFLHGSNARQAWANLLYVNNFLPFQKEYMPWCWSLAIEEQFYLLLPGFILLLMRRAKGRIGVLTGLLVAAGVIRLAIIRSHGMVAPFLDLPGTVTWDSRFAIEYQNLYSRYGALVAGVIAAYVMTFHKRAVQNFFSRARLVNALGILAIAGMVAIAFTSLGLPASLNPGSPPLFFDGIFRQFPPFLRQLWHAEHRDVFAVCATFLILAAINAQSVLGVGLRRVLSFRLFYPIAQLSYSLYLIHEMLLAWLFPKTLRRLGAVLPPYPTIAADCLIGLGVTVVCAVLLYVFVEKPSMNVRSLLDPSRIPRSARVVSTAVGKS